MRSLLLVIIATGMGLFLCISCGSERRESAVREPALKESSVPTGFVFKTVKIGDRSLDYVVYAPRDYTPEKEWPAIVFLHGSGESGTDGQKQIAQGIGTNILWNASRWPCIVMMPQKPVQKLEWEAYDDLVMAMLAQTRKDYSVDQHRIALTGLSQGGHGSWMIGAAHADVWCAIAPICGYPGNTSKGKEPDPAATPEAIAGKVKGVPVWCFHGADDDVVPPARSQVIIDAMIKAGATPKFTLYPATNHGSWDKAYAEKDLPTFLMTAKK
jgi:predicted peptidase